MQYESQYYGVVSFTGPRLMHHGIKGQKWGVRRFQNEDGSYTSAGKKRYQDMSYFERRSLRKAMRKDRFKTANDKEEELTRKNQREIDRLEGKKVRINKSLKLAGYTDDDKFIDGTYRQKGFIRNKDVDTYNHAQQKINSIQNRIADETRNYTRQKMVEKYGHEAVRGLEKSDNRRIGALAVGSLGLLVGSAVALERKTRKY